MNRSQESATHDSELGTRGHGLLFFGHLPFRTRGFLSYLHSGIYTVEERKSTPPRESSLAIGGSRRDRQPCCRQPLLPRGPEGRRQPAPCWCDFPRDDMERS